MSAQGFRGITASRQDRKSESRGAVAPPFPAHTARHRGEGGSFPSEWEGHGGGRSRLGRIAGEASAGRTGPAWRPLHRPRLVASAVLGALADGVEVGSANSALYQQGRLSRSPRQPTPLRFPCISSPRLEWLTPLVPTGAGRLHPSSLAHAVTGIGGPSPAGSVSGGHTLGCRTAMKGRLR